MSSRFGPWLFSGGLVLLLVLVGCGWPAATGGESVCPPQDLPASPRPGVTPTPGLVIRGQVWLDRKGGPGLPDVQILRNYASYPGTVVATTDGAGCYESKFAYIPGDEMVTVWAEREGYTFKPVEVRWRHYYGFSQRTLNFVATALDPDKD